MSDPIEAILEPGVREALRGLRGEGESYNFGCRVNTQGAVCTLELLHQGRGTSLLNLRRLEGFDLVLHVHPTGALRPSAADLRVAASLQELGLGFLIVSGDASAALELIPPPRRGPSRALLEAGEVEGFFAPQGPLERALGSGYEPRGGQVRMAHASARALNEDLLALLESGTGTGKTFAYLVPAALYALRNQERIVISTATKVLQEQVIEKDLPTLRGALGPEVSLRVAVVKGRGNYVSLRRAEEALAQQAQLFASDEERREVERLAAWAQESPGGERSELSPPPSPEAWEHVTSTTDNCLGKECPRYRACHFYTSRRRAYDAHLLVANHHLLCADLAIKRTLGFEQGAVLPPFTRVILDEAHHVEAIASEHFGLQVTLRGLERPLGTLRRRRSSRGLLPTLIRELARSAEFSRLASRAEELLLARDRAADTLREGFALCADHLRADAPPAEREARELTRELPAGEASREVLFPLEEVAASLRGLAAGLGRITRELEPRIDELQQALKAQYRQLEGVSKALSRGANTLTALLKDPSPEEAVRWVELRRPRRGPPRITLKSAPLEVGPLLNEALYVPAKSVLFSSATLAVRGRFDFLEASLGLGHQPQERLWRELIPSPFDHAQQALLWIPADHPLPGEADYEAFSLKTLEALLLRSRGRAFALFTSYGALTRAFRQLEEPLRAAGLTPLRQGELSRHELSDRFRSTPGAVLFGTSSFWEGVDMPGEALILVVIARLPFAVPSDPLQAARARAIEARGGSAFYELTLPRAALKLTQGFGRLIRTQRDRGLVAVLDRRLTARRYGPVLLESLPRVRIETRPWEQVLPTLDAFLG